MAIYGAFLRIFKLHEGVHALLFGKLDWILRTVLQKRPVNVLWHLKPNSFSPVKSAVHQKKLASKLEKNVEMHRSS